MSAAGVEAQARSKSGVRLLARVTPKAANDGVDGFMETAQGTALKVRVRAAPEKGGANRAVEAVLARWLGLAKSRVRIEAGDKARTKIVEISGDPLELQALVAARMAETS
jgi:uncharacterized protein YggU (UPF0235/DUF167 family)